MTPLTSSQPIDDINTIRPSCLTSFEHWEQPTTNEIRSVIKIANLTGSQVGNLVGVQSRAVRRWTGGDAAIPYAAWAILCYKAGLGIIWK